MKRRKLLAGLAVICLAGTLSGCSALSGLFGGGGDVQRDPDDQITQGGNVDAFSLKVGDCLISSDLENEFTDIPAVPCSEGHDTEVIYIFDMPDGAYDDDAITEAGNSECAKAITDYVGPNYGSVSSDGLDWNYFSPTSDSWDQGDREIDCIAYTMSFENELTSSVKGMGA